MFQSFQLGQKNLPKYLTIIKKIKSEYFLVGKFGVSTIGNDP